MQRLVLIALTGIGLASLSGQVAPGRSPVSPPPAVGTAPPVAATTPPLPGPDAGADAPLSDATSTARAKVLAHLQSHHTGLSRRGVNQLAATVVAEAQRYDLDPELILAVIQVESHCYHMAVSPVGALGLMQILPLTGEELASQQGIEWRGPETLFDPIVNVKLGVAYLRQLSDRYRSTSIALAAYNWGPTRIDRRLRRGARVPSLYVEQVMHAYERVSVAPPGGPPGSNQPFPPNGHVSERSPRPSNMVKV